MTVVTIAGSKGGPGKSTVNMLLAGRLAHDGLKVAALDADPAGAFIRWAGRTYEGAPLFAAEADEARLAHLIDARSQTADVVLVDTAGFGNRAASVAMTSADPVLIPALSGEADVTEAENAVRLVEGLARAVRRKIPARVLLTSTLADLVAYGEITSFGRVPEQGTAAGDEVTPLVTELRGLGWIPAPEQTHRRKDMEAST